MARAHELFGTAVFAAGLLGILLGIPHATTLSHAMLLAVTSITCFYFWYGYFMLSQQGLASTSILDFLWDFFLSLLLVGLIILSTATTAHAARMWVAAYAALFWGTVLKYVFLRARATAATRRFVAWKLKTDALAAGAVTLIALLFVSRPLIAAILYGAMELGHMLYVGLTGVYEAHLTRSSSSGSRAAPRRARARTRAK